MTKKRILAIGIIVAVISVTGIIVYNTNRNEADTVETVAHIETDEATTPTPPTPVEEDKTSVDNTTPVKEDNESIETEDTTPTDNTTPTEDTTPVDNTNTTETEDTTEIKEDTVDSDITPLDQTMYAQGNVNTRSGPSTDYEKIGGLSVNEEVHVIGQSKSTGWYEIEVSGSEKQFVSNQFLSTTKITLTQTTPTQSTTTTTSTQSTQSTQSQTTNPTNSTQTTNAKAQAILDALGATYDSGEPAPPSPNKGHYTANQGVHAE